METGVCGRRPEHHDGRCGKDTENEQATTTQARDEHRWSITQDMYEEDTDNKKATTTQTRDEHQWSFAHNVY